MRRVLEETLTAVETLLGNKEYQKALDELEKLNQYQLDSEDLGYYCILLSDANINLGIYDTVLIDKAIDIFKYSSDTEKFARAKSLKGYLLSLKGCFADASEILNEAYVNFKRCDKIRDSAKTLNRLAYCSFKLGNINSAIFHLQKVIEIYINLGDKVNEIKMAHNLAHLFYSIGSLNKSNDIYKNYNSVICKLADKSKINYYYNSAITVASLNNNITAKKTISKAKPFIDKFPREKAIYFENLGLINILSSDYKEAEKALHEGLKISLEIAPKSALISQIKRLFGDLYIATGKYELAEKYTNEALVVAEKIGEKIEIAACYRIFAQLEQHKSAQVDKAKEYYTKAIDLFKLIGSRYELSVTQYIAATSGLYHNGERHAMLYMARDYFESEGVMPFLNKIESALKNPAAKEKLKPISSNTPEIITVNPKMKKLVELAENVAQSDMSILLTGETGTGKDLMASYIHHMSCREGNFVEVNCPLFADGLFEVELFGSVKGAYTGSDRDRIGRVELANNGTLFLNEVGDIPIQRQVKLLRVIETGEYEKVGSSKKLKTNFRVIAATNLDLEQRIQEGKFRADLYYRLKCVHLDLPPLRERIDDIPELVKYIFNRGGNTVKTDNGFQRLTELLSVFPWTGNVRELKKRVEELIAKQGHIDDMINSILYSDNGTDADILLRVLKHTDWNRSRTAELFNVSEGTIRNWIRKYGLLEIHS